MVLFALGFLAGNMWLHQFSMLPPLYWGGLGVLAVLCCIGGTFIFPGMRILAAFFLSATYTLWCAHILLDEKFPQSLEGKTLSVSGEIVSLPVQDIHQTHFLFRIHPQKKVVRLNWAGQVPPLWIGDQWRLHIRLKRIHSLRNPGGMDYEAFAFAQSLWASGYVVKNEQPHYLGNRAFAYPNHWLRQVLQVKMNQYLPTSKTAHWIPALAIGERTHIPPDQWEVLRNTGTNHLMAIAGLHIGFLSWFFYQVVTVFWRRIPWLTLRYPAKQAGMAASLLAAIFYSGLAGFSVPTQRASLMLSIFLLSHLFKRIILPQQVLSIALVIVLFINPFSPLGESFWLSFGTLLIIVYTCTSRLAPQGIWWRFGRMQWVIGLGLIPLSFLFFEECSLISFVANTIAIPVVGFLLLPMIFLGCVLFLVSNTLAGWMLSMADHTVSYLWAGLSTLSHLSLASWHYHYPHPGYFIVASVGLFLCLLPSGVPGRLLGCVWFLPLFVHVAPQSLDALQLTVLDVGQGLATVIQTKNHVLVYDTGARLSPQYDMGESVVTPFLRTLDVHQLDAMIISHADNDHSGGNVAIRAHFPPSVLYSSTPEKFLGARSCLAGTHWVWDGVLFEFLYPTLDMLNLGNDSSCVLRVVSGKHAILLVGDIEKIGEKYLVAYKHLASDIMVAPHHGSKTSSRKDFVEAVGPRYVVFSVGYRNRYHFPNPKVVERYTAIGASAYETQRSGAITFHVSERHGITVSPGYRLAHQHYWND